MIRRRRGRGRPAVPLLTDEARAITIGGFEDAGRLRLPYVGCEHWLIALAGADHPAGAALRAAVEDACRATREPPQR